MESIRSSLTASVASPRLVAEDPGVLAIFVYRNFCVFVWNQPATAVTLECISDAAEKLFREQPDVLFSTLQWVAFRQQMPPPEIRARLAGLADELVSRIACIDFVLEHGGFWASAFRAAIAGIGMLMRNRIELRVDGSLADAASWLAREHLKRTGVSITAKELTDIVQQAVAARPVTP